MLSFTLLNESNTAYTSYSLDNFNNNTLLIIGYSGSGKSTLAFKLSTKYNAPHIVSDTFESQSKPTYLKKLKSIIMQKEKRIILEGIHILECYGELPTH